MLILEYHGISDISEAECFESLQDIKNGVDPL